MGQAKKYLEHLQQQRDIATEIAVMAGVLKECEYHSDIYYEGGEDVTEAYKLGSAKFKNGEFNNIFQNQRELTDAIKAAVEDNPAEGCPLCAKWAED